MPAPSNSVMLDVDTILGLPRPTKKPSSLKKPRQPPPPRYINKERALAIAKKFKISKIGKVSVRASDTVEDLPKVSLESEKVLTRRILLDREKGLETARNSKDSAVGKCILGRNDYETRRLGVEFDQLNEDVERRKYQLLRRKSVFVHKRGLTLTQNGIVFDAAVSTGASGSNTTKKDPRPKPLPGIQNTNEADLNSKPRVKRDKSPSYMRPLSCDRTRSTDSQVAEVERFLASPTMLQFTKGPDDDSTMLALQTVTEVNSLDADSHYSATNVSTPTRRVIQTELKHSDLPEIAESVSSSNSELDNVFHETPTANFPITKPLSRSTSVVQSTEKSKTDEMRRHSTAYSGLRRSGVGQSSKSESDRVNEDAPVESAKARPKSRRHSRRKSSMHVGSRPKSLGKTRSKRVSFSQNPNPTRFNVSSPSKDPRFTELTSFLIPDSAKAFDLYRSMGRLSVLDRLQKETESKSSDGLRTKTEKIGKNRSVGNIKSV